MIHTLKTFLLRGFFPLSVLLVFICPVTAQIASETSDFSDTIVYEVYPEQDLFHIFHTPDKQGNDRFGSLLALSPDTLPLHDFEWRMYDTVAKAFGPVFHTETGMPISRVTGLESGCYSVRIRSGEMDTVFRAWVFRNDPLVSVVKDANGEVPIYSNTCSRLWLSGTAVEDTHYYYDLSSNKALLLPNSMDVLWTTDNDYKIDKGSKNFDLIIANEPPYSRPPTKDTRFIFTGTDEFGLSRTDTVLQVSVHVKAEFSVMIENKEDPENPIWEIQEEPKGEAPLEIRLVNLSENGTEFWFTMVDSGKLEDNRPIYSDNVNDTIEYKYYIPGYYYPKLLAQSSAGCRDSFPLEIKVQVQVEPSELDVPNAFSPNHDGVNDVFIVKAKSLRKFRVTIYSRSGNLVYQYNQTEESFEWEGWDGTIDGKGNRDAAPGVYYYVIEALGWDTEKYRDGLYRGFVYLFRNADDL